MVIALTGQKGGVGKSTVAICLAAELSLRGHKVLLVDADPQGSARTWGDVAAEAGHPFPTLTAMGANMHKPNQLPKLAEPYEYVVIDSPPRHGDIQRSALMCARVAILPCRPSGIDAWALTSSLELIQEACTVRPQLKPAILITRKQAGTAIGKGARDVLKEAELPILKTEIGYRVAYQEAIAGGQGVTAYAPKHEAAAEIRALTDEILTFGRQEENR